ncbi:Bifunctional alpha-galactosidase/sucrose kinase AgaSK [Ligilactobacillus salivarius]|uniref:alpha-galactosidase n=1 Tax=Ligilactobacillus salivarius TaxID=1624 RepID=UPI000DEB5550|nr:alpha-galactosidase [Ligilactobacillus salivarius]AYC10192.1 Bifunctional alpha-galactosidase/sucrose kinase AgaSK [Ligilactobacillus salivarius]MBZ4029898.1 alpha-galactosidase [Ligilactobacillus salivarius]MDM8222804.1 alpha-galactosidase [Ligilactobacillus salivarius]
MPITYNEQSREFHLYNNKISYLIKILANEQLGQLYFGKRIPNRKNHDYLVENTYRPVTSYVFDDDYSFSLGNVKQEYPAYGTTDQRRPALDIKQPNGSRITDFKYVSHKIYAGKRKLTGLPATYVEDESEATTLEINLYDELIQVTLCLQYTIFENSAAIARSVKFSNDSDQKYQLKTALSLNLDLPDANYEWLQFSGAWGRERHLHKTPLRPGIQAINSARGASSHMQNPFVILKRPFTTEEQGEALGVSFVYSGNFLAQAEVDEYSVTRLQIGIDPFQFSWCLKPNETFQTPEAILAYTSEGLNQLSQTFQKLYTTRLARGYWRDKERPILINNWEATYFDFTEEKLLSIAKKAKELGIELFVLDDGWFGERTKETAGLGDWYVNRNRLKNGISGLSRKIHDLGMMFGLWFEPEMVNKDSDLYRKHPDYIIETPKRHASHGRKQYVLDFSRKEVVDNIYEQLVKILDEGEIDYIKWDMNRNITECYSIAYPSEQQGEIMHRYILGVYDLYERLIERYPKILFESCASGGGRFDAGMLYYAPQAWTSDDSDAIERLKIQYGTSFGYPQSMMGAHVSASPNEQLGRNTPLKIRGDVAFFGAFGYELDLDKLSSTELASIKKQIELMKKYRSIFQYGTFYRLKSPFEGNIVSWMVVSEDKSQAIVGYYKILNDVNCEYRRLCLPGLDADTLYNVQEELGSYLGNFTGDELANIGLVTTDASAGQNQETTDFYSKLFILERCGELSD